MEKNPFSIHDFLGYVLPGGVALLLAYMVLINPGNQAGNQGNRNFYTL